MSLSTSLVGVMQDRLRAEKLASLGVIIADTLEEDGAGAFMSALARNRFPERETDPPRV